MTSTGQWTLSRSGMCPFGAMVVKSCCALFISFSFAVVPRGPHVVVGKSTNWRRTMTRIELITWARNKPLCVGHREFSGLFVTTAQTSIILTNKLGTLSWFIDFHSETRIANMEVGSWGKSPCLDLICFPELELPEIITMLYIKIMRVTANKWTFKTWVITSY